MRKNKLDQEYWNQRYESGNTPWELQTISNPLKNYIDQLSNKKIKILIPGSGSGNEAKYLHEQGFKNVFVNDISPSALSRFLDKLPNFPEQNILSMDFFEIQDSFDLIIEQTFFCAIDPKDRIKYVNKTYQLLTRKGKLVGLFFNFPLTRNGPPYGGNKSLYKNLFNDYFKVKILTTSYNSVESRKNKELFFIFEKA